MILCYYHRPIGAIEIKGEALANNEFYCEAEGCVRSCINGSGTVMYRVEDNTFKHPKGKVFTLKELEEE
jgi:hypothetical protein